MEKESTQYYFNHADVFMVAINRKEVVVDINMKACDILGCQVLEVIGKNWFDNFVPEQNRQTIKKHFHNMLEGILRHVHYEHPVITSKGQLILDFHNVLISDDEGTTLGILSSGTDITKREQMEKAAARAENSLQVTLDTMIEGCQIIDYDWRYTYVNESAAKQGRKSKQELLGYTMMQAYPGIENTELFNHLRNCMINRVSHQIENEFIFPDASKGWFELRIEPVPQGILILSVDITKRRVIETELQNYRDRLEQVVAERTIECAKINEQLTLKIQEQQLSEEGLMLRASILDNTTNAIFLVNAKGDFAYANNAASKAYGYSQDELLNMNISSLLQSSDVPSINALLSHISEKGETTLEMVHQRKDGALMPVKLSSNTIKTKHGQFIIFIMQRINYR